MMRAVRLLTAFAGVAMCGCASVTTVQTADSIGRGNLQWGIETGIQGISPRDGETGFAWPHIDLSVRYGVAERLDVGARLGQSGVELHSKLMLTPPSSPLIFSLLPSVGGSFMIDSKTDDKFETLSVALPLLLGIRIGEDQLVLAPRAQYLLFFVSKPAHTLVAGASIGYALRVSPNFIVMPELGFTVPTIARVPADMARFVRAYANGPIFQLSIGLLLGHTRTSHPEGELILH